MNNAQRKLREEEIQMELDLRQEPPVTQEPPVSHVPPVPQEPPVQCPKWKSTPQSTECKEMCGVDLVLTWARVLGQQRQFV